MSVTTEFKDKNGTVVKLGDTIEVWRSVSSTVSGVVTSFSSCGQYVSTDGSPMGYGASLVTLLHCAPCCSLEEAADLLEAEGVQVDRKQLDKVLNPRPATLHIKDIRLHCSVGYTTGAYTLVQVDTTGVVGYLVISSDHNRWTDRIISPKHVGHMEAVNLDKLEKALPAGFSIIDTWSDAKPELLECC